MALTEDNLNEVLEDGIDTENPGIYQVLLEDLQGNILKGHGRDYSVFLFLQWKPDDINAAKQWLQEFSKNYVTSAQQQSEQALRYRRENIPGGIFTNVYLTRKGYEVLGYEPYQIPGDQPFRMGMKDPEIRGLLNDPEVKDWEKGYQQEIHALILIAEDDLVDLLQFVNRINQDLRLVADIVHREDGFILRNKAGQIIEHFGFVDGVSQPLFTKRDIVKARTNDCNFSQWDSRANLGILLVKDPNGKTEDSYGSYLVYRKLEQNVAAFRRDKRKLAETLNIGEELAGALAVGRFYDGTPVTKSNIPTYAVTPSNNFNYEQDTQGLKCPFHAHIRKTNPRGDTGRVVSSPGFEEAVAVERIHRIARRAVSYGENDPTQEPETGAGLLFLCFQADIENQFNFMQIRWANPKNFIEVNTGPDPIIGQPEGNQKWPKEWGKPEKVDYTFKLWAFMKGGEYFFAPSISFLTHIASET
ncbi:Dyp-type peroxidase [Gloeothece verrucosa]|uniref:Dyp-type peroxidase family n=1 Tax=Gloeothece verrucosa (strain PCC 7822) TaxID=497965 RepID=E0UKN0_GLOV7|nr:Dyp-type peroxidase [Gloeothece verrucosa]ADN17510.1 Dyp-type peroxidase family [Gloeothece verrucosa PCC 7822]